MKVARGYSKYVHLQILILEQTHETNFIIPITDYPICDLQGW